MFDISWLEQWGVLYNTLLSDRNAIEVFKSSDAPFYVERYLAILNEFIAFIVSCMVTTTFHISVLDQFGVKGSPTKFFAIGP